MTASCDVAATPPIGALHFRSDDFYNHAMIKRLLPTVAVTGLFALGACGSSGGDGGSDSTETPSSTSGSSAGLTITAKDGIRYDAAEYTATAGDVDVVFDNESPLLHDVYFKDADGVELPTFLEANGQKSDEKTVKLEAGTYEIYCKVPGHGNMKATVTVK